MTPSGRLDEATPGAERGTFQNKTCIGGRNLYTPHPPEAYPGLAVVRPTPGWRLAVICLQEGQTLTARGGEQLYAYRTGGGARAEGFVLGPGDRATLSRSGLPFSFVEWRIDRASGRGLES